MSFLSKGAKAKEAVMLYLDYVRKTGGEEEVQAAWQRIWIAYIAVSINRYYA